VKAWSDNGTLDLNKPTEIVFFFLSFNRDLYGFMGL